MRLKNQKVIEELEYMADSVEWPLAATSSHDEYHAKLMEVLRANLDGDFKVTFYRPDPRYNKDPYYEIEYRMSVRLPDSIGGQWVTGTVSFFFDPNDKVVGIAERIKLINDEVEQIKRWSTHNQYEQRHKDMVEGW